MTNDQLLAIRKCQEMMRIAGPLGFVYKIPSGSNPEAEHSLNRRWRGTLAKILTSVDFKNAGFKPNGKDAVRFLLLRKGILWELCKIYRTRPESFDKRFDHKAKLLSRLQDELCLYCPDCPHEWTRTPMVCGGPGKLRIAWECHTCGHKEFVPRGFSDRILKETPASFLARKTRRYEKIPAQD